MSSSVRDEGVVEDKTGCLIASQFSLRRYVRQVEVQVSELVPISLALISSRSLLTESSCFLQFLNPFGLRWILQAYHVENVRWSLIGLAVSEGPLVSAIQ